MINTETMREIIEFNFIPFYYGVEINILRVFLAEEYFIYRSLVAVDR